MGFVLLDAYVEALNLAQVRVSYWLLLRRLCRRGALGLAVPLGFGLGAWAVICVGAFVLPGVAAAAMPPMRIWAGCAAVI